MNGAAEGTAWRCDTDVAGGQHALGTKIIIKREKRGEGIRTVFASTWAAI